MGKDEKPKNGKKKAGKQQETEDSKSDVKPAKRANKGKGGATTVEEAPEAAPKNEETPEVAPKNEKAKNGKKVVGKQEKEDPKEDEKPIKRGSKRNGGLVPAKDEPEAAA